MYRFYCKKTFRRKTYYFYRVQQAEGLENETLIPLFRGIKKNGNILISKYLEEMVEKQSLKSIFRKKKKKQKIGFLRTVPFFEIKEFNYMNRENLLVIRYPNIMSKNMDEIVVLINPLKNNHFNINIHDETKLTVEKLINQNPEVIVLRSKIPSVKKRSLVDCLGNTMIEFEKLSPQHYSMQIDKLMDEVQGFAIMLSLFS